MTASEKLVTQKEKATSLHLTLSTGNQHTATSLLLNNLKFDKFLYRIFLGGEVGANPINVTADENVLLIQFCLKGSCNIKNESQKKSISFKKAEYNIMLLPKGECVTLTLQNDCDLAHIYLSEEFFYRYMPQDYSAPLYNLPVNGKLFQKNLHLSAKLKSILNEIEQCDFGGNLKNLYTKAKIIELLSLQLAQYEEEKLIPSVLKPLEVEKMIVVKEIIENNLNEAHTITALARAAGTNEQYLKKHFKMLFGSTVFGYITSCKMEKAKEMLLSGKYRITEIAEIIGYKHATHFTSAFKKFFGYLPQTLKTTIFGSYFSFGIELEAMEILMMI